MNFTLHDARNPAHCLFECITGSRAYGTVTPDSDTDIRGIFVLPRERLFGLPRSQMEQVSDATNDETFYEIGRFVQLLTKNNPNILEMLFTEPELTRFRHPLMDRIDPAKVLSKLCRDTFAGYAMTQVRKARGLNKKIVNPMDGPRKPLLDFCHVVDGQGSVPLADWLSARGFAQKHCGLVNVPHMRDTFAIFQAGGEIDYRGVVRNDSSTDLLLSSIPKGETPVGWMQFNTDGYKKYCREYREYHEWLAKRNDARYATNIEHGRNYDSKNLMHTFRLLDMAAEIAEHRTLTVRRPNREFLMQIRSGEFDYDELIARADVRIEEIHALYEKADLPDEPDVDSLEQILIEIRRTWHGASSP